MIGHPPARAGGAASPAAIDLRAHVRPGDRIAWGQGSAEPPALSEALVAQRHDLGGVEVLLGVSLGTTLRPEHADALRFRALGGFGTNQRLARAGVLEVVPAHFSALPGLISSGELAVDVVFALVSPADSRGRHCLGFAADYMPAAIESARAVIAEVNPNVPRTPGAPLLDATRIDAFVHSEGPLLAAPPEASSPLDVALGERVAELVPDGATLQVGIGSAPRAACRALRGHRDLGLHSALIDEALLDLIEAGAITNAAKSIDRGVSVAGLLLGGERLHRYAGSRPPLRLMPASYTHAIDTLARIERFHAVNSAIEVDLTGAVNSEAIGKRHVGAVGGAVDFARGAAASSGGRAIVVLPSTARDGEASRIVPRLRSVTTTPRSDADLVVTEHGIARLRGRGLAERARELTAIANPAFREELERAAAELV